MKITTNALQEYAQILLGIVLASIGLKAFLLPNGFLDGGVTGIAILINELYDFNISISLILISIPFLILAWFTVSKTIVFKSVISIIGLAIIIHLENFMPITDDKLLIAIFGGIFLGAGIGIAIRNGTVLDGSEILGIYINNRFGFSIGGIILFFNTILFIITGFLISMETAMYSTLTYLVTTRVIDFFIKGFEDYVGMMIISKSSIEVEQNIVQEMGTGITVYKFSRGYGNSGIQKDGDIIHLIINRIDIRKTYNIVNAIDKEAFIVEFDVNNITGGVFRRYLSKSQRKLSNEITKPE